MSTGLRLNIGCGRTFHPAWLNFDLYPADPSVRRVDIRAGLPLADGSCAVVYHAHVIEHLKPAAARAFLAEVRRVLAPGGIVRVVVPDLEQIAQLYLRHLECAAAGGESEAHRWMTLELVDQLVRDTSGGEMGRFLRHEKIPASSFIAGRLGGESLAAHAETVTTPRQVTGAGFYRRWARRALLGLSQALLGRTAREGVSEGLFRATGEVHRWMYDRVSLAHLLEECGFTDMRRCAAADSSIPDFASFKLDADAARERKPDSLYMEACRS